MPWCLNDKLTKDFTVCPVLLLFVCFLNPCYVHIYIGIIHLQFFKLYKNEGKSQIKAMPSYTGGSFGVWAAVIMGWSHCHVAANYDVLSSFYSIRLGLHDYGGESRLFWSKVKSWLFNWIWMNLDTCIYWTSGKVCFLIVDFLERLFPLKTLIMNSLNNVNIYKIKQIRAHLQNGKQKIIVYSWLMLICYHWQTKLKLKFNVLINCTPYIR